MLNYLHDHDKNYSILWNAHQLFHDVANVPNELGMPVISASLKSFKGMPNKLIEGCVSTYADSLVYSKVCDYNFYYHVIV